MIDYEQVALDLVAPIVDDIDSISVKRIDASRNEIILYIYASSDDVARLIGRRGIMASSIRQMMSVAAKNEHKVISIKFETQDA